jgi:hypothetical protein
VKGSGSSRSSRRRPVWVRLLANTALVITTLVVSILICEVVLRVMHIGYPVYIWTDPVVGVAHIPGARSENTFNGQYWISINKDGMRGPEAALKAPAGTFRIALLGDSFIEAFEVPYEQTAGEVIERRFSDLRRTPVEVLNFGHGGYGTTQELLTLQHKVWKYSPDMVLLAVTPGNDISDNVRALKGIDYVPYHVFQGDTLVLDTSFLNSKEYRARTLWTRRLLDVVRNSHLAQLVNRVRHARRKSERQQANPGAPTGDEFGLRNEVEVPPTSLEWQNAWRVTEELIRMMRDECRKKNTPFALVTVTRGVQVTPVPEIKQKFLRQLGTNDPYYPERRLAELGKREGIPVLALAPTMAKQAEERKVFFHAHGDSLGIGHWNKEGHQAAGELIASWLAKGMPSLSISPARP